MKIIFSILGIIITMCIVSIPIVIYVNHKQPDLINATNFIEHALGIGIVAVAIDEILKLIIKKIKT